MYGGVRCSGYVRGDSWGLWSCQCLSPLPALPARIGSRQPPAKAQRGVGMAFKILIVDDSSTIRHLLRLFIEHDTDWQVCGEAENGQIAIEKVIELEPQAVILDLSMPIMNGLE